jgi:hypothetical protein
MARKKGRIPVKKHAWVFGAAGSAVLLVPLTGSPAARAAAGLPTSLPTPAPARPGSSCPIAAAPAAEKATTLVAAQSVAGGSPLAPTAINRVGDGGAIYVYQVGAHRLTFPVPPAGFNPLTASPAQLAQYGLPAMPADPNARPGWNRLVGALRLVRPPDVVIREALPNTIRRSNKPINPVPQSPSQFNTDDSSYNWAGKVSYQSGQPTYYTGVQAGWTQPSISATACAGATHLTWVGIGGYRQAGLLQDGTDQNNQPWFEYLGPPTNPGVGEQIFPNNLTITPGDSIFAGTAYTSGYSGEGQAWWLVEDQTTGQATLAGLDNASPFYDGSSAEFIDERTCSGTSSSSCVYTPLADYGETVWTGAEAATSSNYKNPVATLPGLLQEHMVSDTSNNTLAVPADSNDPGTWKTGWENCS